MARRPIDNRIDFLSPVTLVPGIGSKREAAFTESGIETLGDLLNHFPHRYIDRSNVVSASDIHSYLDKKCAFTGIITQAGLERGRRPRFRIQVSDETGSVEAVWFQGVRYIRNSLKKDQKVFLYGKVVRYGKLQMVHPMIEKIDRRSADVPETFVPVYPLTGAMLSAGISQRFLAKSIKWIFKNLKHYPQTLPPAVLKEKAFPPLSECLENLHFPLNPDDIEKYNARIVYEELYQLAVTLKWNKRKYAQPGRSLRPGELVQTLINTLPFSLTGSQKKAVDILLKDSLSKKRMHRLLQGDVGCGKTIVAFMACLPSVNNGLPAVWLTPTTILARQTHERINEWLSALGIRAEILTGDMKLSDKRRVLNRLSDKEAGFIIGTHSLLYNRFPLNEFGMIVIDEQHKFGVKQRLRLQEFSPRADLLLLSATPIPGTLAKTVYGDLELVTIDEAPKGRAGTESHIVPENKHADMERFILSEIRANNARVIYVVSRIDSEEEQNSRLKDVEAVRSDLKRSALSRTSIGVIHGGLDNIEKEKTIEGFKHGSIDILIATTVVEVGVDIPSATIMVIENPDRFGLSQLHQLRGRVGRGKMKGYCFLMAGGVNNSDSLERLRLFCSNSNGFEISELDLKLRGPGEVSGLRQTGLDGLVRADIIRDSELFREIQNRIGRVPD